MNQINIIKIDFNSAEKIYNKYPELISAERRERIDRIKPEKDRILSFFAEIEMRKEISDYTDTAYENIKFSYNPHGKPYMENAGYHFSVSHSGNLIAFVLSDKAVGIDTEYIKKLRLRVAERFFTSEEYNYILKSENPENTFYRIWTAKESYLKMLGTGLSKSLNSFNVLSPELKNYFFTRQYENYILTVCHENALNTDYKIDFSDSESLLKSVKEKVSYQE